MTDQKSINGVFEMHLLMIRNVATMFQSHGYQLSKRYCNW